MRRILLILSLFLSLLTVQAQNSGNFFWSYPQVEQTGGYGYLYNFYATQPQISEVNYGYLYNWWAATGGSFVSGWHLPTITERDTLVTYLGGTAVAGGKLKEIGTTYFNSPNTGATNEVGFNSRGSGLRGGDGVFSFDMLKGVYSFYYSNSIFYTLETSSSSADVTLNNYANYYGCSIRLICDSSTDPGFVDIDGHRYATVKIGDQVWMAENLMAKNYADGTPIPEVTDNTAWTALTTGARCSYANDESNAGITTKITSSDDWFVPSKTQYYNLGVYFGGVSVAGGHMKKTGTSNWVSESAGTDNSSGFTATGSGTRFGSFSLIKEYCSLWNIDEIDAATAYASQILATSDILFTSYPPDTYSDNKTSGASIRLCNPTTALSEGATGTYTQNNGEVIPTIVINGIEWTMNLTETQFRDGTYIHGFEGGVYTPISDEDWSLLEIPGVCVYGDDLMNK